MQSVPIHPWAMQKSAKALSLREATELRQKSSPQPIWVLLEQAHFSALLLETGVRARVQRCGRRARLAKICRIFFAGFLEAVRPRCALLFPLTRFIFYKRAKKDTPGDLVSVRQKRATCFCE